MPEKKKKIPGIRTRMAVILAVDEAKKFAHFETDLYALSGYTRDDNEVEIFCPAKYPIKLEDLAEALNTAKDKKMSAGDFLEKWYDGISGKVDGLRQSLLVPNAMGADELGKIPDLLLPVSDEEIFHWIVMELDEMDRQVSRDKMGWNIQLSDVLDMDAINELLKNAKLNRRRKPMNRKYSDAVKRSFIIKADDLVNKGAADDEVIALYRIYTDELADKGDITALKIRGYACYGGNPAYEGNWETAKESLSQVFELTRDPGCANSLGYIYFYGRVGGEPDYEKAFRYFTFGALNGIYESTYKLADLYAAGLGTWKSPETAKRLIEEIYYENLNRFSCGEYDGKFADVALRMGNICEKGIGTAKDPEAAYFYYLQAKYAIKLRRKVSDQYGDNSVQKKIEDACRRTCSAVESAESDELKMLRPFPILQLLMGNHEVELRYEKLKDGRYKLSARRIRKEKNKENGKILLTFPEYDWCELVDEVVLYTGTVYKDTMPEERNMVCISDILRDPEDGETEFFTLWNSILGSIKTDFYTMIIPKPNA